MRDYSGHPLICFGNREATSAKDVVVTRRFAYPVVDPELSYESPDITRELNSAAGYITRFSLALR